MNKIFAAILILTTLFVIPVTESRADELKLTAVGPSPIKQSLVNLKGKTVTLKLRSGQEISGRISEVSEFAVLISELIGKEYFDAVVAMEGIDAIIARAR